METIAPEAVEGPANTAAEEEAAVVVVVEVVEKAEEEEEVEVEVEGTWLELRTIAKRVRTSSGASLDRKPSTSTGRRTGQPPNRDTLQPLHSSTDQHFPVSHPSAHLTRTPQHSIPV